MSRLMRRVPRFRFLGLTVLQPVLKVSRESWQVIGSRFRDIAEVLQSGRVLELTCTWTLQNIREMGSLIMIS